jgi:hypothetical protein
MVQQALVQVQVEGETYHQQQWEQQQREVQQEEQVHPPVLPWQWRQLLQQ